MDTRPPPALTMIGRGLRRRCPLCGGGGLFRHWVEPRSSCPRCGLRLDRGEDDFFLGSFTLNFIAAELLVAVFLLSALIVTWPDVPWRGLVWAGAPLVVLTPVLFYPVSRTLWLAIDLTMRPPAPRDFAGPGSGSGRRRVS
jgi:uncharacterized protein (DUF983 family)